MAEVGWKLLKLAKNNWNWVKYDGICLNMQDMA